MLTFITGAPGSGKTLWTMREVEKLRKETGRPVLYNGIPGVTLSEWKEISSADLKSVAVVEQRGEESKFSFDKIPTGAIVVVDEVYRLWPQGKPGEALTPDKQAFATHRHAGLDFYMLSQDRQSLHHFVRGLTGRHVHLERQFGINRARVFEWQRLADPRDSFERKAAMGSEFIYPKEVFGWYKSADAHTVKKRLPWFRLALVPALLVVAGVSLFMAFNLFRGGPTASDASTWSQPAPVSQAAALTPEQVVKIAADTWAAQWSERVKGQPMSASLYDPTLRAATMPKISGCIEVKTDVSYRCECNTQQGTIISTLTVKECRFYLRNGWFDPTKPDQLDGEDGANALTASAGAAPEPLTLPEPTKLLESSKPST